MYAPRIASKSAAQSAPRSYIALPTSHTLGGKSLADIRAEFPILAARVNGGRDRLVWLDNAATTQKPRSVIERIAAFYERENSNVHRGAHELASHATDVYEEARQKVAQFLGAPSEKNIVFVRGTTEGINLVANAFVRPRLREGDEIIVTLLEHHANIVPWQLIAEETGAFLRVAPVDESGQIDLTEYKRLFNRRTRFASFTHVSNAAFEQPRHRGPRRPSLRSTNTPRLRARRFCTSIAGVLQYVGRNRHSYTGFTRDLVI